MPRSVPFRSSETYWNQRGRHQSRYDALHGLLVPPSGKADTPPGELLRSAGQLYKDHYTNGGGNIRDGCYRAEVETLLAWADDHAAQRPEVREAAGDLARGEADDEALERLFDFVVVSVGDMAKGARRAEAKRAKRAAGRVTKGE